MSVIVVSIVCSAIVSALVSVLICMVAFEHIERANETNNHKSKAFIEAAILVLQSFCDCYFLDDERAKAAVNDLVKQMEQEE